MDNINSIIMQGFVDRIIEKQAVCKEAGLGSIFAKGMFKGVKTKAPKRTFSPRSRMKVIRGRKAWERQYRARTEDVARQATSKDPRISQTAAHMRDTLKGESARTARMQSRVYNAPPPPKPSAAPSTPKTPKTPKPQGYNKRDLAIGGGVGAVGILGLSSLAGSPKPENYNTQQYQQYR